MVSLDSADEVSEAVEVALLVSLACSEQDAGQAFQLSAVSEHLRQLRSNQFSAAKHVVNTSRDKLPSADQVADGLSNGKLASCINVVQVALLVSLASGEQDAGQALSD